MGYFNLDIETVYLEFVVIYSIQRRWKYGREGSYLGEGAADIGRSGKLYRHRHK